MSDMEFLEVLTEGLDNVLMVRGSGSEVITIYSWCHQLLCTRYFVSVNPSDDDHYNCNHEVFSYGHIKLDYNWGYTSSLYMYACMIQPKHAQSPKNSFSTRLWKQVLHQMLWWHHYMCVHYRHDINRTCIIAWSNLKIDIADDGSLSSLNVMMSSVYVYITGMMSLKHELLHGPF